jgi:hypothetical protein
MGDGMLPGYILADVDEDCKARPGGALGNCYRFTYSVGEEKWAGVYWQHPANNWGSRPGRSIGTTFSGMKFTAAAEYHIVLPAGGGVGASCADDTACRPGLSCAGGACAPAGTTPLDGRCLISAECAEDRQCSGQKCIDLPPSMGVPAAMGQPCGTGDDLLCVTGLQCSDQLVCVAEGAADVGQACGVRNDCRAGLYCSGGACRPRTKMGPFQFMVGGISPPVSRPDLQFADQIGVGYFPMAGDPLAVLGPDWQRFRIDLSAQPNFSTLIGAFMWAVAFPNIDLVATEGKQPYLGDPDKPATLYFDDIVFETAQ